MTKTSDTVWQRLSLWSHYVDNIEIQPKDTSRGHFYVSMIKSVLRIIAGAAFAGTAFGWGSIFAGGCLLMMAEVLGILEEIV